MTDDNGPRILPDDIQPAGAAKARDEDIVIRDYSVAPGAFRGRSILRTNAISLVMQGRKTMHFAAKTVHAGADEIHLLSSGHCIASMELSGTQAFRSVLVFFGNRELADFHAKYDALIRAMAGRTTPRPFEPYVSFRKDPFIRGYISGLASLLQSGVALSPEMKRLKIEELLLHLLETQTEKFLAFRPARPGDLSDFELRRTVEANVTANVSLEELAFLCACSLSTFKRRFMKLYGTSPSRWIREKRMSLAAELLQHHGERPSDVYFKVGYENHSSFSQSFKETFGVTPKAYHARTSSTPHEARKLNAARQFVNRGR